MNSTIGIRALALANNLAGTGSLVTPLGVRESAELQIEEYNTKNTYRGTQVHSNQYNVKLEADTYQGVQNAGNIHLLKNLTEYAISGSAQMQFVGMESVLSGSVFKGDVYTFESLGTGYEFILDSAGKECNITAEGTVTKTELTTVLTNSATATSSVAFDASGALGHAGINYSLVDTPVLSALTIGGTSVTLSDVNDYKLSFATESEKTTFKNRDRVKYIKVSFMVELLSAKSTDMITYISKANSYVVSATFNYASTNEVYNFAVATTSPKSLIALSDDKRSISLTFEGNIPLRDMHKFLSAGTASNIVNIDLY